MANELQAKRVPFTVKIDKPGFQKLINTTLKDPKRAERFVASLASAVDVNPNLQNCDAQSIVTAALVGESLNLSPSPYMGHYYLVPYQGKNDEVPHATFQIGYKGILQLAIRSGYYSDIDAGPVRQGEYLGRDPATGKARFHFMEDDFDAEKLPVVGYFATFEYLNGFKKTLYWSREKMLAHADRYSPAFSANGGTIKGKYGEKTKVSFDDYIAGNYPKKDEWMYSSFWYKDFDAMAIKTMLRQLLSKWGIMSIEMQTAFDKDVEIDAENFLEVNEEDETEIPNVQVVVEPETVSEMETVQDESQIDLSSL